MTLEYKGSHALHARHLSDITRMVRSLMNKYQLREYHYEDILQDCHLAVSRALRTYDPSRAPPGNYIYVVVLNTVRAFIKRSLRNGAVLPMPAESTLPLSDPYHALDWKLTLESVLVRCTPEDAVNLQLAQAVWVEGCTLRDVAPAFNLSYEAVRLRLNRLRKRLARRAA